MMCIVSVRQHLTEQCLVCYALLSIFSLNYIFSPPNKPQRKGSQPNTFKLLLKNIKSFI